MPITKYTPLTKSRARKLRNSSTLGEIILWKYLKKKQLLGLDFNRQEPLYVFIADFYNCKYKIVIEVDGSSHNHKQAYDARREKILRTKGITVLRVSDYYVKQDVESVIKYLETEIKALLNTLPRSPD